MLGRLHAVDPQAVGLADFGRPDGFLARQLRRWSTQWEHAQRRRRRDGGTDPATAAELTRLADALAADVPTTQRHTVVHGDYRIDNCLYDAADPGTIRAVLDWELSTLGDPLADLGLLLVYWHEADDRTDLAQRAAPVQPDPAARFPAPDRDRRRPTPRAPAWIWPRCRGTSRSAAFKLAVVLAGILARVRAGMVPASMAEGLEGSVDPLVALGHHVLAEGLDG